LTNYFETLYQADNRITELSKTRLYPKIGFFFTALIIYFLLEKTTINKHGLVWLFYLLTLGFVYLNSLKRINLSFKNLKTNISEIWEYNKSFGFDVYIGSVLAVGFASLSGVIISYFGNDNTGVGFYSLAFTFASPLTLIPNVIATTHYKEFAQQNNIPKKLTHITIALTLSALVVLWIIVGPFINIFYAPSFHPVIKLNFIVSIGMALHGLADYYNRFLGAHGKGKILRNSSIIIGISLLVANVVLIPIWGATGAAFARLIGGAIYLFNMLFSYRLNYYKTASN
jgi:O-antigen/teichoic acid export membrane protein